MQQGLQYAFGHPTIRILLFAIFVVGFSTAPYSHLMPAAVAELYAAHPELVGMFLSAAGFGAMSAWRCAARPGTCRRPFWPHRCAPVPACCCSACRASSRGRVMAIYTAMFLGAVPLGSLVLGQLGDWLGTARALALGGASCLCGAAYYARKMDRLKLAG